MITERRFLTGFRSADADTPGLVQEDDGTVWLVAPDGTRTQISGGGFVPFQNWCVLNVGDPPTLNTGTRSYYFAQSDLTIARQSGSDFSIGEADGVGTVFSAEGGWFQGAWVTGSPFGVTLDGGSTAPRFLKAGFSIGVDDGLGFPGQASGFDAFVPVIDIGFASLQYLYPSVPAYVPPGGRALWSLFLNTVNLTGSDEITSALHGFGQPMLWQVGAAT